MIVRAAYCDSKSVVGSVAVNIVGSQKFLWNTHNREITYVGYTETGIKLDSAFVWGLILEEYI